jgi:YidC/Oxa1 family membrane protein insertase
MVQSSGQRRVYGAACIVIIKLLNRNTFHMNIFVDFFSSILSFIDSGTNNLGLSIIIFTVLIRLVLLPLTIPSIKSSKKIQELQPEIKKLKEKHGKDKQALALAQAQLYKSYNINPLAGCLPQLLQLFILIVLYQAIMDLFNHPERNYNLEFLWVTLSQRDVTYIMPIIAGVTQFLLSVMIIPATHTRDIAPNEAGSKENQKEEDIAEMAVTMQQQMMYLMPVMTTVIAISLPSGLALYWIVGTVFTVVTQYFVSGWGGLAVFWNRYAVRIPFLANIQLKQSEIKLTVEPKKRVIKKDSLIDKLTNVKKEGSSSLAAALQQTDGSTTPVKVKNKKATKPKKKNARRRK